MADSTEKKQTPQGSSGGKDASRSPADKAAVPAGSRKVAETRIIRGTKPPEIPVFERKNWLVHQHYLRKDFETCKVLIGELLETTDGLCEYAIYVLGLIKRQEGDIPSSLELFQRVVKLNHNNPAAVRQVARSLFLLGRHKTALDTYTEALSLSPHDWEVLHNMGVCCIYLRDYDQAVERFEQALQKSPQSLTFTQLGRVHLMRAEIEEAIAVYNKALQHYPEDSDLLSTLGLLYLQTDETKKAFECLGGSLTFDPSNSKAILAAGAMIQDHGDYDVALSKYRVSAHNSPESPQLWNNIGMCFFGKGKTVAAISCLKRATYLAPFEWQVLHNLGLIHLSLGQHASAYHFLRAAIALRPKSGKLFMLLAVALTHLDDYENACKAYEQALSLDKEDALVHLNYSILLYTHQHRMEASKQFSLFEKKLKLLNKSQPIDQEMEAVAARLGPALLLGEDNSRGDRAKQGGGGSDGEGAGLRRGRSAGRSDGRGGREGVLLLEPSAARRRAQTLWSRLQSTGDDDYQEPQDAIPIRERKLSNYF